MGLFIIEPYLRLEGHIILRRFYSRFGVIGGVYALAEICSPLLVKSSDDYLFPYLTLIRSHRMTIFPFGMCSPLLVKSSDDYPFDWAVQITLQGFFFLLFSYSFLPMILLVWKWTLHPLISMKISKA
jgi:hypothetical protein